MLQRPVRKLANTLSWSLWFNELWGEDSWSLCSTMIPWFTPSQCWGRKIPFTMSQKLASFSLISSRRISLVRPFVDEYLKSYILWVIWNSQKRFKMTKAQYFCVLSPSCAKFFPLFFPDKKNIYITVQNTSQILAPQWRLLNAKFIYFCI